MTGTIPFSCLNNFGVVPEVLQGGRPGRPIAAFRLTDDVWKIAEECWSERASERPPISSVLYSLNKATLYWDAPSAVVCHVPVETEEVCSDSSSDFSGTLIFRRDNFHTNNLQTDGMFLTSHVHVDLREGTVCALVE